MPDALSAADRASLAAERGPVNMNVGGVLVFEAEEGVSYDAVVERLKARLPLLPRYRQRLHQPAFGLAQPAWTGDTHFDPYWHVRLARLPAPGGAAELEAYVAREMSRRLDRSRPLWELHVIEGLGGSGRSRFQDGFIRPRGRTALLAKMHHALVDGIAAVNVGTALLDPTPEPLEIPLPDLPEPSPFEPRRYLARLAATPFVYTQRFMIDGAKKMLETSTSPWRAADDLRRATDTLVELAQTRPQAPWTPLNREISPNRSFSIGRTGLGELKVVGKAGGGTVNDAVLALVTGMVARYVAATREDLRGKEPVALVPVSVRREPESDGMGNRISTVLVDLPIYESDPLVRVARIAKATTALKGSAAVGAGALLVGATGWAPPIVSSMLARAMGGISAFNVVVSNVPGPQQPFYLNGARLLDVYPVVPLNPANQGLSVGVFSYDGSVFFGLLADRELDPPLEVAARAFEESLGELLEAAGAVDASRSADR